MVWDKIGDIERERSVIIFTRRLKEIEVDRREIGWDRIGDI